MSAADIYAVLSDAILAVLLASAPVLVVALVVGLGIALFQALTQIQEMTLTFVPKIVAIFVALLASLPFVYATLEGLSDTVFDLIVSGF
ncbi:putative flagellar biosynthetic transmembrane protein [Oceanicola granulosus HTCC2516]|uniref:Putative flagellar biosynthetic transmembrane protein n=1 Tax=Oceanicola granulosus (strain ATCC BAA-861 / DSM 15982 / KCTC 12143 / HTCC2516) TaxID=314256 RepID=Q2CGI9_OCEGH|nr:flagellar biosynthetic protein FliQ [Oceanicola granulosus]EAR51729.1 putative flagellar biosynthetic transmembrane protein [Oceanicola granulosus HTCC2516]